jgi:1-pyrroline-5-carboxylate dehydrogenase
MSFYSLFAFSDRLGDVRIPHEHKTVLGQYHKGGAKEVRMAIESALKAKPQWEALAFEQRVC